MCYKDLPLFPLYFHFDDDFEKSCFLILCVIRWNILILPYINVNSEKILLFCLLFCEEVVVYLWLPSAHGKKS